MKLVVNLDRSEVVNLTGICTLDTDLNSFQNFAKDFPWVSTCDLKSWEEKAAKDYFVFGTPTMYLLAMDNKIVLKLG